MNKANEMMSGNNSEGGEGGVLSEMHYQGKLCSDLSCQQTTDAGRNDISPSDHIPPEVS